MVHDMIALATYWTGMYPPDGRDRRYRRRTPAASPSTAACIWCFCWMTYIVQAHMAPPLPLNTY